MPRTLAQYGAIDMGVTPGMTGGRDFRVGGRGGWGPAQEEEDRKKQLQMQALADLMLGGKIKFSSHNPLNAKLDRTMQEYAGGRNASTSREVGLHARDQAIGSSVADAIDYEETQAKALSRARKIGLGSMPFESGPTPQSYPNALAASGGAALGPRPGAATDMLHRGFQRPF